MIGKLDTMKAVYKLSKLLEKHSEICSFTGPFALIFKLYVLEEFPTKEKYIGAIHSLLTLDLRMSQLAYSEAVAEIRNEIATVLKTFNEYFSDFYIATDIENAEGTGKQVPEHGTVPS